MNEECFAKEMKKIQSVVSRALQKANALTALADGGKMSREKLQLTLEETAYFFESATLYLRALCETQMPGVGGYGRRDGLEFQLPSGHIEIAGAGWVHMQLDIESEILFSEAFLKWLELYKSPPARKPSTYASYLDTYRIHFAEAFGNLPLYQITQDTIQDYYQRKQKNGGRLDGRKGGLSAKTIQNQHMLLKDFFAYAMRKYQLPCNPTVDTTRPEVITPEMRVLSPSEMQVFIEEVMRETQRVAILTTLFVGFRVGEVLALKISDLDLEKQTLSVTKNLIRVPTAAVSPENPNIEILNYDQKKKTHLIVQNTPKTSTSNREIAISDGLCELLIRHLFTLANSTWPNPDGLLFPSKAGTHLDPKSFEIRLAAVSKRCEIRKVNPHALRHTLATRLVEDKVPLNIVQGILGHSSIETTRKYLHKNEDIEREAIGMMSDYLNMGQMDAAPRLNGTASRAKFADIVLPTFPQRRNHTA